MRAMPSVPHRRSAGPRALLLAHLLALASCGDGEAPAEPLRVAVLMPVQGDLGSSPNLEWAVAEVNAAGGVAGRPLALDYFDPDAADLPAIVDALIADDAHVAVIGPPGSIALAAVADAFVAAQVPIVSTTSTSDDLLRAYGGKGAIWRTRESDVAQTELLVRHARRVGAERIALLTSLEAPGATFFGWFGFFARELGYPEDQVTIVPLRSKAPCDAQVVEALAGEPDVLFIAPGSPAEMLCVAGRLPPIGAPRPRVIFADTGLDPNSLVDLGGAALGIEGFTGAGDEAFEAAFRARFPGERLAPHGPGEYDAVLLLAYGLERSGGDGGAALIEGMRRAVDGRDPNPAGGPDAAGIAATLAEIRAGGSPALHGASGELVFEPDLYMDLASSTFAHYTVGDGELILDERVTTNDPTFLTSQGAFVRPSGAPPDVDQSSWSPKSAKTDTWALIAALSSGFDNYRHQADALQQYQLLRASGVDDDHIVLVIADDLALDPDNDLPGEVRNTPGGADLYGGAVVDYRLGVAGEDLQKILLGQVTPSTPTVLAPTASSDVYVFLVGHGGEGGIPIGAATAEEGLAGGDGLFAPTQLREALCGLAAEGRYRRAVVVIESCYSGVFGDADAGGVEYGCGAAPGEVPLEGAVVLTAANGREVSYAGAYDDAVPAWVNDAFARNFADNLALAPGRSLADVFADSYRATAGSHPSAYNLAHAGRLGEIPVGELFSP